MHVSKLILLLLLASTALMAEPVLTLEPRDLRGVPGEPLYALLTVEATLANSIRISIPAVSNLVLRAVEKIPIQRNSTGRFVQQRRILWQGLEAGKIVVTNLTVELDGVLYRFPHLGITVDAVQPAPPPLKEDTP